MKPKSKISDSRTEKELFEAFCALPATTRQLYMHTKALAGHIEKMKRPILSVFSNLCSAPGSNQPGALFETEHCVANARSSAVSLGFNDLATASAVLQTLLDSSEYQSAVEICEPICEAYADRVAENAEIRRLQEAEIEAAAAALEKAKADALAEAEANPAYIAAQIALEAARGSLS